jgi:hypothetical protein
VFRPPPPKPAQTSVPRLWQKATRDADALPSVSVLSIHPYPLFRGAHARVPSRPSPGAEKSVASLPHHAARAQRPSTRCACAFVGSGRVRAAPNGTSRAWSDQGQAARTCERCRRTSRTNKTRLSISHLSRSLWAACIWRHQSPPTVLLYLHSTPPSSLDISCHGDRCAAATASVQKKNQKNRSYEKQPGAKLSEHEKRS